LVGVKSFQRQLNGRLTGWQLRSGSVGQSVPFFMAALKCFFLVPVFPMLGYYLLDQTGFSHWMIVQGLIPARILGEGFGHVGLCFSIHYVFTGFHEMFRAFRAILRQG
jgi:hypothetical protein